MLGGEEEEGGSSSHMEHEENMLVQTNATNSSDKGDEVITLVVQGEQISADRQSLALTSNFFKALFKHKFRDSQDSVLSLDSSGQMGLTVHAVKVLAMYSETKKLDISGTTAIPIFIAADALDAESIREDAEMYVGQFILQKQNFTYLWRLSRQFYMKILVQYLDGLVCDNFGWFTSAYFSRHYMKQWSLDKLKHALLNSKFKNCSEEQIFQAVMSYCRNLGDQTEGLEMLAPALSRSCSNYLRYIQSVPRGLTYTPTNSYTMKRL